MSAERTKIYQLLQQLDDLDHGDAQIELAEEAVRLADAHGDLELRVDARMELISAATFGGSPEKALVAFSWCLAQYDQDPELVSDYDLLWKYKWIVNEAPGFPQIPQAQLLAMLDDMERRYQQAGVSLRPVYQFRHQTARFWNDQATAELYLRKWLDAPRDYFADCAACELSSQIEHELYLGKDESALAKAQPILNGRVRCSTIPHTTYAKVLLPLIRQQRHDEAVRYHQKGYRLTANNKDFLDSNHHHLQLLALGGKHGKAVKVFEKQLLHALAVKNQEHQFHFYLAAWLLFDLMREQGRKTVRLRLPADFPAYQETGQYDVAGLADHCMQRAQQLAATFNRRNGNEYFTQLIAAATQLKALCFPWPEQSASAAN